MRLMIGIAQPGGQALFQFGQVRFQFRLDVLELLALSGQQVERLLSALGQRVRKIVVPHSFDGRRHRSLFHGKFGKKGSASCARDRHSAATARRQTAANAALANIPPTILFSYTPQT